MSSLHPETNAEAGPSRPRLVHVDSHGNPQGPFHALEPIISRLSVRSPRPPPVDDGFDNYPPDLPSDPVQLERRLTQDPDVEKQMLEPELGPPPDGGRQAWLVVMSAFFISMCVYGFVTCFGTLSVYYLDHQLRDYSKSDVAWIASVQITLTFIGSIGSGRYFDSHGARNLVVVGTTLNVLSLIATAFCQKYYQFMLAHALYGISGSVLWTPSTAIVGHWFLKRRGTAAGIAVCGSGLGGIVYPIMLNQLFGQIGFKRTMIAIAGMNAGLMLPAWFFLNARLPPRRPPPIKALLRPWKEKRYAFLVLGSAIVMMNWITPYFNAPILTYANPVSQTVRSYSVTLLQIGSFVGRAGSGYLSDKLGTWRVFIFMSSAMGVTVLAFWTANPLPEGVVVVGLVLYGITSGAWITLVAPSTAAISPTKELGMRVGMLWTLAAVPIIAGPSVTGLLVVADNSKFTHAGIFCGVLSLVGSFVTVLPRTIEVVRDLLSAPRKNALESAESDAEKGDDQEGGSGRTSASTL